MPTVDLPDPDERLPKKQLNARIPLPLWVALQNHFRNPITQRMPHGAIERFVTLAVRNELEKHGIPIPQLTQEIDRGDL